MNRPALVVLSLAAALCLAGRPAAQEAGPASAASPSVASCEAPPKEAPGPEPKAERPSADKRRSGGRFVANLGRSLVGVVSKDNLKPFLIASAATGLGASFDDNVERYFSAQRRAAGLGNFGEQLGRPYVIGPLALGLYAWGRLEHRHQSFRDASYDVAQVTLVAALYTTALKYATQRERPDGSNNFSFPSGHTSNAFAWATIGAHYYGWRVGVPGFAFAGLIGVSRMEKNAHWLTDVLAGAGLGYLSGRAVIRKNGEPPSAAHELRLALFPVLDPHGGGAGLGALLAF